MIGRLSGKLIEFDENVLLIDAGGVGYEVEVSAAVLAGVGALNVDMQVYTHFVVREDAQLLYGFVSKQERELFRTFIKISGVGPKLGLALISSVDTQTLAVAVRNNDVSVLTKVPGVGKKTAERLMVELKSRLDMLTEIGGVALSVVSVDGSNSDIGMSVATEAEDALVALGYRAQQANRAVAEALQLLEQNTSGDEAITAQALVRLALRGFAKQTSAS